MKKILALLLAVVMVLGLVACASKDTSAAETTTDEPAATETKTEETTTEEPAAEETTEEPAAETGAVISKVALVTDVGTIDDESFNQATWQGVKAYCEANGIEYTYYQPTAPDASAGEPLDERVLPRLVRRRQHSGAGRQYGSRAGRRVAGPAGI